MGGDTLPINKDSLRGYILEEVLAYLIRRTGYRLLVDPSQDERDLDRRGNGLVVKGRGGVHQVDVLGQLSWIPAFTFPLRLFVEAKFRNTKTGIEAVRNAIGVTLDINQNNFPTREQEELFQKYQYEYALFSTSGFSKPAIEMALAHQISLIDLGSNEYSGLLQEIDRASEIIVGDPHNLQDEHRDEDEEGGVHIQGRTDLVSIVRNTLRRNLGTWPEEVRPQFEEAPYYVVSALDPVISATHRYDELLVAMANGPFMLLLKADNVRAFLGYSDRNPRHKITIGWSSQIDNGKTWEITPVENFSNLPNYRLTFRLPARLVKWIFGGEHDIRRRALQVKEKFFSDIMIYRYIDERDSLYRLQFDAEATREKVQEWNRRFR